MEVTTVPIPVPDANEHLLEVLSCALCRTDVKMWRNGHRDLRMPRILGHEVCARDLQNGRRYVIWPGLSCGHCRWCQSGVENLCPQMSIMGFHRDGGLAERVAVPGQSLIPVPSGLSAVAASLAEPLACTLNALAQLDLPPKTPLLIIGGGPVGLLMALAAKHHGLFPVVLEKNDRRLVRAASYLDELQVAAVPHPAKLPKTTFAAAVCATSAADALLTAFEHLAPGGRLCFFSGLPNETVLPVSCWNRIHYRQLSVVGAYGCTRKQMEEAVAILAGTEDSVLRLIDSQTRLEEVPKAFPAIEAARVLKIVVTFNTT